MKNKSYIFCFLLFVAVFSIAYLVGGFIVRDNEPESIISNEANIGVVSEEETTRKTGTENKKIGYWIKADEDYIVIYNSDGIMISNTEISIEHFEDSEKQILREGIYVESAENLFRYLESYTS